MTCTIVKGLLIIVIIIVCIATVQYVRTYVARNESMKKLETYFKAHAFKSKGYLEVMPPYFLKVIQTLSKGQNDWS